MRSKQCKYT